MSISDLDTPIIYIILVILALHVAFRVSRYYASLVEENKIRVPFKLQILKYGHLSKSIFVKNGIMYDTSVVLTEYDGMSNYINLTVEDKVSQILLRLDVLHSRIEYLMNNEITNELLLEYIKEVKPELFV